MFLTHFLGVEIFFMAGHMFSQTEDLHLLANGSLNHIFQRILGMARAELARMTMMREWHILWMSLRLVVSIISEVKAELDGQRQEYVAALNSEHVPYSHLPF